MKRSPLLSLALLAASLLWGARVSAQQAPAPAPIDQLKTSIERVTRSLNATWGIYMKCLETGEEISINADVQMDTMSVIKLPLMVEVFEQIKAGKLSLADKYTLKKEDVIPGSGILRSLDPGAVLTLRDAITLMNIVSDNTATDILFRAVGGPEAVNARMKAMGLTKTRATGYTRAWFDALREAKSEEQFHREGKTPFGLSTPREIGRLLEGMERGTLVDKASSERMLKTLRGQVYASRIPRYVTTYYIPHKTGDFTPYIANDVGVIEMPGRTVVLCVFTANHYGEDDRLEEAIARIAAMVTEYHQFHR